MLNKLDWNTYLELNDYIGKSNFKEEFLSCLSLVQYSYYGFEIKYNLQNDFVILYIFPKKENVWKVFTSYYKEDADINLIKKIIKDDLKELNGKDDLSFYFISENMINDWDLKKFDIEVINGFISNYIYEIDKMKTFKGKKLQKKRNHLNYFNLQNHSIKVENIKSINDKEIINYISQHITNYSESFREYELEVYKKFLENGFRTDQRFNGIVVYINNEIVGLTIGFLNNDVYEVIIEKANKDIRGLYQFIIAKNLEFNNINCKYMDREDDAGNEFLAKSKMSYYPILMVKRYNINNVKGW